MSNHHYKECTSLLLALTQALHQDNLWAEQSPPPEALVSAQPFACDTLTFAQWLQFIFLPTMTDLIAHNQPLPKQMALTPMAEMALPANCVAVLESVKRLDDFTNARK